MPPAARKKKPVKAAPVNPKHEKPILPPKQPGDALPIPGAPPKPLRNYTGIEELVQLHPSHDIHLDYGTFMWLWRIVEAKALLHHNSPTMREISPQQVDVALRAATAFREAAGTVKAKVADPSQGKKRVWGQKR